MKLKQFLYDLLRDHLPTGVVEKLVEEATDHPTLYSNIHLSHYCDRLIGRLNPRQREDKLRYDFMCVLMQELSRSEYAQNYDAVMKRLEEIKKNLQGKPHGL